MTATRFMLNLLGGFELRVIGGNPVTITSKKAKALLAYLALSGGKAISREKIAAMLWPLGQDEHARTNLRQTLYVLRKVMSETDGALISTDSS